MEGFKEGARLAASHQQVREHARDAGDLEEAFTGATRRAAEQAAWRLSDGVAADFPDRWSSGVGVLIPAAVDAALVLGARAIAGAESYAAADLVRLAEDEIWLSTEVDHLLLQVIETLVRNGHPVPGAQSFIDRTNSASEPDLLEATQGDSREVRTSWIRNADTGENYQWCVRQTGPAVLIRKRRCGATRPEVEFTMARQELEILVRILRRLEDAPAGR